MLTCFKPAAALGTAVDFILRTTIILTKETRAVLRPLEASNGIPLAADNLMAS